jgi:probable rRNA maturation factor
MRALNRTYRGLDSATDVLSFPSAPESQKRTSGENSGRSPEARYLGDIVIARGIARKQAGNLGHSFATEARVLALHGLLHLLGYDHEVDNGRMARVEGRLRRKAGLPTGLIARSS